MAQVRFDPPKPPGVLTSWRSVELLKLVESCAGASSAALALCFPDVEVRLKILRGAGYVRRCHLVGQEPLWIPISTPLPVPETYLGRLALGWLACRAVEAGCRVSAGHVRFPSGQVYRMGAYPALPPASAVIVFPGERRPLQEGYLSVTLHDLQERRLPEALRRP